MTISLAQEYRPGSLDDVLGQELHVTGIKNMVASGKFPGAFLLGGPAGTGKTSLARLIAKILTCRQRDGHNICGACEGCRGVDNLGGANYYYLDGGAKNMSDLIREELIPFFQSRPTLGSRYKVLVLDEFQRVTDAAKSILLAPLEELPTQYPWVVTIFTTTTPETIDEALQTRCTQLRFEGIDTEAMVEGVLKFRPELNEHRQGLTLLAERCNGCMRRLWTYVQQHDFYGQALTEDLAAWMVGEVPPSEREKLWKLIEGGKLSASLKLWDSWIKKGANAQLLGERLTDDAVLQAELKPDSGPWLQNFTMLSDVALAGKPAYWRYAVARLVKAPYRKADPVSIEEALEAVSQPAQAPADDTPEASAALEVTQKREAAKAIESKLEQVTSELNDSKIVKFPQKAEPADVILDAFAASEVQNEAPKPGLDLTDLKAVYEVCFG